MIFVYLGFEVKRKGVILLAFAFCFVAFLTAAPRFCFTCGPLFCFK